MKENSIGLKAPLYASLALAFASFGDAFLYPFLPVNHAAVGVPVAWIGVLLSVNRFVRIFSNTLIVRLLARNGLRLITVLAAVLAILSTAGYVLAASTGVWLLLRVVWGLAFSAMRISTIGYSLQQSQQGLSLGLTRGVQEAGPMVALLLAPAMLHSFNTSQTFTILTVLSLPAIYFALKLPKHDDKTPAVNGGNSMLQFPSWPNAITLTTSFLIDGVIVVVLGMLFLHYRENINLLSATSLAAFYLGYRRVCFVLLSPVGGWAADRLGLRQIFSASLLMMIIGLAMLAFGWIEAGAIVTFTFYSVHAAITPGYASILQENPLAAVAENATWRDIGAAAGTLAGGLLLSSSYLNHMLTGSIFGLAILFMFHLGTAQRTLKLSYPWR